MSGRRILMTADAVGGIFTYAVDLAAELVTRRNEVVLAVLGPAPDARKRESAEGAGATVICPPCALDWTAETPEEVEHAGRLLASLAREQRVDLVHLNHPALAGTQAFQVPVIAVAHSCVTTWWSANRDGPLPPDLAWRGALTGRGYRAASAVIAPTCDFAEATWLAHGLDRLPTVVPNGRRVPRGKRRLSGSKPFVMTAGRLWDDGKNLATLDRAAARLAGLSVVAAGPSTGPNGASIVLRHVEPLGPLGARALDRLLRTASAFVSTARYEPFGLAVLEAAQRSTPLILADTRVFRELWADAALFVPAEDDGMLAQVIAEVASDDGLQRRLGAAAFERSARYTAAAMAEGTLAVHDAALAGARRDCEVAA